MCIANKNYCNLCIEKFRAPRIFLQVPPLGRGGFEDQLCTYCTPIIYLFNVKKFKISALPKIKQNRLKYDALHL